VGAALAYIAAQLHASNPSLGDEHWHTIWLAGRLGLTLDEREVLRAAIWRADMEGAWS
jgi:hypothetical protein